MDVTVQGLEDVVRSPNFVKKNKVNNKYIGKSQKILLAWTFDECLQSNNTLPMGWEPLLFYSEQLSK